METTNLFEPRATPPQPAPESADRNAELGTLREVARALAAGIDSRGVLNTLCDAALVQGHASGASVAEVSGDTGVFIVTKGIVTELKGIRFPLAGSLTAKVMEHGHPVAVGGFKETSSFFGELLPRFGVGPILVNPLMAHGKLLGVLSVFRKDGERPFDPEDAERLAAVADLAALALWNARLLEEARAGDAAKTSLLATLSHELRTPLAAIEGYGELLEDEILGPLVDEQRDVLTRLRTVSRHLGALIEDILTYASLEAERVVPRNASLRLEELLDSLHPFVEPLAREKGINFRIGIEAGLPLLYTDEARVRQILLNLCQNAVKFTEQGEVYLRVSRGSPSTDGTPTVRCVVVDSGIGIATGDLQRLFRPFSQLDDGPTRRHRGTGLGLYISRRLATVLGGRIEVVSRPGEGSTFTLVLPVRQMPVR